MLQKKLGQAKKAYDEEFELLCNQYEDLRAANKQLKEDKILLRRTITELEQIIIQYANLIEAKGYSLRRFDADIPKTPDERIKMVHLETMQDNDTIPKKPKKFLADSKNLLRQEFNFYTFGIELNNINRVDVMNGYYVRHLEKKIIDNDVQADALKGEVIAVRRTIKGLRATEEESNRIIHELRQRFEL